MSPARQPRTGRGSAERAQGQEAGPSQRSQEGRQGAWDSWAQAAGGAPPFLRASGCWAGTLSRALGPFSQGHATKLQDQKYSEQYFVFKNQNLDLVGHIKCGLLATF